MIDTNVKGLLYMTPAILPLMVEQDKGHVIDPGAVETEFSLVRFRGDEERAEKGGGA